MNKKYILLILMILLFSVSVNALLKDGLITYWGWEGNANNEHDSGVAGTNGTVTGGTPNVSCQIGTCYQWEGDNDYISYSWGGLTGTANRTMCAWINSNDYTDAQRHFILSYGASSTAGTGWDWEINSYDVAHAAGGELGLHTWNYQKFTDENDFLTNINDWYFVCVMLDSGGTMGDVRFFRNATESTAYKYTLGTSSSAISTTAGNFYVGYRGNTVTGGYWNGTIDDMMIWNRSITLTEMAEVYQHGLDGEGYSFWDAGVGSDPPSITLSTNLTSNINQTENPYFFYIDGIGTVANVSDSWTVRMYLNNTLNLTQSVSNLNTTAFILNLTYGDEQKGYDIFVNVSNENVSDSFTRTNVFLDSVPGTLDISTTFTNNSLYYHNIHGEKNYTITCTDPNLFACNVTLIRLNGDGSRNLTILNNFTTDITTTSLNLIQNFSINNLKNFRYQIYSEVWDSHTDNIARQIDWEWIDGTLYASSIGFYGNFKQFTGQGDLATYFYYATDRYKMKVTFNDNSLTHSFTISAPGWSYVGERYGYKGHFVNLEQGRWMDFMGSNIESVDITPLGNDYYQIDVQHYYSTDEVEFESIGDLNYASKSWYFNVTDGFSFTAKDHFTSSAISSFSVNVTQGGITIQNKSTTTGNLTFNLTGIYNTTVTSSLYATNSTLDTNFTSGGGLEYDLYLTNSLLLFFYDEDTDLLINSTNITIQVLNPSNESLKTSTITGSSFVSGFAPGSYTLEYQGPGYLPNTYFVNIAGSDTQSIDLYLVSNVTGTLIVFDISDEKGNPIKNATLKRSRFMINDNAYILTGMSKTDSNGQSAQYLVPNDVFYKFTIEKDGTVIFTGNEQKIFSTLVYFRVSILPDLLTSYNFVHDGGFTSLPITWNNDTDIVSFTWTDTGNTGKLVYGCLRVVKRGNFEEVVYGPICSSSNSATVQLNMSGIRDNTSTFIAQGIIETNSTYSEPMVQQQSFSFTSTFERFAAPGLFMGYIFIFTMFMIGVVISFSVALIFTILSLIILNVVGLTFFGWTMIVIISVVGIIVSVVIKN